MKTYAQEVSRLKYLAENNKKNNSLHNSPQDFYDLHAYMEEAELKLQENNEMKSKIKILQNIISEMNVAYFF